MASKSRRWIPAALVPVVVIGGALAFPLAAGAAITLPAKSPRQLLELVAHSSVRALSGTITQTSDLGLPQLPSAIGTGSSNVELLDALTANHTARVYLDGPTKARVQVLDSLAERDVIRNGADVWTWDSKTDTATHLAVPEHGAQPGADSPKAGAKATPDAAPNTAPDGAITPAEAATRILAAVGKSTDVTVASNLRVAGRTAYVLVLTPKTRGTLVSSVTIDVDSHTGLPLGVAVYARGQSDPAASVAFTQVTLGTPEASVFAFTPPQGATVTEQKVPDTASTGAAGPAGGAAGASHPTTTFGSGWTRIVELPASALPTEVTGSTVFGEITKRVAGGRLLGTSLVNILITTDGRVFAGSVSLAHLQAAASQAP